MKITFSIIVFIFINLSVAFAADVSRYGYYESISLNDSLRLRLKNEIEWITPLNLTFCLEEILFLIKNEASFKVKWNDKIMSYQQVFNDSLSYYLTSKEIRFFEEMIKRNQTLFKNYSDEIKFLNKHHFSNNYKNKNVLSLLKEYPAVDNKKSLSTLFLTSIIIEGEAFIKCIETDSNLKNAFENWVSDIQDLEFLVSESINYDYQIIKRKQAYIISSYGGSLNPLMKKFVDTVKKSKIIIID